MIDKDKIKEVAEYLQGTCKSLNDVLEEHGINEDDMSTADYQEIDDITLLCDTCGWWNEPSEMIDETCEDCHDNFF